jgi:putative hydrolase of the HAD superfamily
VVDEEQYAWFNGLLKGPHVDSVLDALKDHGLAVGIVSNASFPAHTMRWQMEQLGLLNRFDCTIFSSEVGLRKPNRAIYAAALRELKVQEAEALFIGDRVREDVLGPRAIGVDAVLTHEFRQEDPGAVEVEVVRDLSELLEVVDRRLAA